MPIEQLIGTRGCSLTAVLTRPNAADSGIAAGQVASTAI